MKKTVLIAIICLLNTNNASAWWLSDLFKAGTKTTAKEKIKKEAREEVLDKGKNIAGKSKSVSVTRIALLTTATNLLAQAGIAQIEEYPVSEEIADAIESEKKEFHTKVCKDQDGIMRALPKSFTSCPFGDNEIIDGPILKLD